MEENALQLAMTGCDKQQSPQNKLITLHLSSHQVKLQLGQPHKLPHVIHEMGTRPALYVDIPVTELSSPNSSLHATWWLVQAHAHSRGTGKAFHHSLAVKL